MSSDSKYGYVISTPTGDVFTWSFDRVERAIRLNPGVVWYKMVRDTDSDKLESITREFNDHLLVSKAVVDALEALLSSVRSNSEDGKPKNQDLVFSEAGCAAISAIALYRSTQWRTK